MEKFFVKDIGPDGLRRFVVSNGIMELNIESYPFGMSRKEFNFRSTEQVVSVLNELVDKINTETKTREDAEFALEQIQVLRVAEDKVRAARMKDDFKYMNLCKSAEIREKILREAVETLLVGACGVAVRHPEELKLLQECVDLARKALKDTENK